MRIVRVVYLIFKVPILDKHLPEEVGTWLRTSDYEITMNKADWIGMKDSLQPHTAKELRFESPIDV